MRKPPSISSGRDTSTGRKENSTGAPGPGARRADRILSVVLTLLVAFSYCVICGEDRNSIAYSISKADLGELEGVSAGLALFAKISQNAAKLTVWDIQARKITAQATLPDWQKWTEKSPEPLHWFHDVFRFQGNGDKIVALQAPWVVLIDLRNGREVGRALASEAFLDPRVTTPSRENDSPGAAVIVVNPVNRSVAVAFNLNDESVLFLYDATLKREEMWPLPRYVRDLCWSPDGHILGVLYADRYNGQKRLVGRRPEEVSPEPDVWLLDTITSKPMSKFSTGSGENQILFGNGGKHLYAINTYLYGTYIKSPGLIRVFETPSGRLIKTIKGPKKGVHDKMELSPDGRFIAADATTEREDILRSIVGKETIYNVTSRIVVFNVESGDTVFERHAYGGDVYIPSHFGFSASGRLLLSNVRTGNSVGTVSVYSLGGP